MEDKRFSFKSRVNSFSYAFQGLGTFFRTQTNAWIHLLAAIVVVLAGFYFEIKRGEWLWIIAAISGVFITEMFNTALEFLCDHVSPGIHPQIKKVKDVAAAAVLISSLGAIVIGSMIFLPRIISF